MPNDTLFWFKSAVGTFWIAPHHGYPGRVSLGIGDDSLGSFASPEQAADDVYLHSIGLDAWDLRKSRQGDPCDLSEWQATARGTAYLGKAQPGG